MGDVRILGDHNNKENGNVVFLPKSSGKTVQQSRAEGVVSKKDSKIRQLIDTNNKLKQELKRASESNASLEREKWEAQKLVDEMRTVIEQFQRQLEDATELRETVKTVESLEFELENLQQESLRYKKQVGVLTRALAVTAVDSGMEGDALLSRGEESWREAELMGELEEFRRVKEELANAVQELEVAKLKLSDKERLENDLTCARVEADKLLHEILSLESRLRSVKEERERAESRAFELEQTCCELKLEAKQTQLRCEERLREYAKKSERVELDFVALESASDKYRVRVQELELLVEERDRREQATGCEISLMKAALADFDQEIRRLAASLSAEAESNENLSTRLTRVEGELEAANQTLAQLRRKIKDLESDVSEGHKAKSELEKTRHEKSKLESVLRNKEGRISELVSGKESVVKNFSIEVDRLSGELKLTKLEVSNLKDRCAHAVKERDRFKSLLASETLARMR